MPTRSSRRTTIVTSLAVAATLAARGAGAQQRILRIGDSTATATAPATPQSGGPVRADVAGALLARGDSAGALRVLRSLAASRPGDGLANHRVGMLAWAMALRGPSYLRFDFHPQSALLTDAVLQLERAVANAPDSARFALDLGHLLLSGPTAGNREDALEAFDRALRAARRVDGPAAFARMADSIATLFWRRYERVAGRVLDGGGTIDARPGEDGAAVATRTESFAASTRASSWAGEQDYTQTEALLRVAVRADSTDVRVRRHLLRLLAERARWAELGDEARRQQSIAPADPFPWLAEGLAAHRTERPGAAATFDRALAVAGPAESARLTRMSRVLPPADAARVTAMAPAERAAFEQLAWRLIDPLWSTPPNELRTEFLARVAHAELRWTGDDPAAPTGADSDAGLVYVRSGPPAGVRSHPPDGRGTVRQRWDYGNGGSVPLELPLLGDRPELPERAVSMWRREVQAGLWRQAMVPAIWWRDTRPASWHNVPITRALDTLPALASRFRAGGDSADVYVAARVPLRHLLAGAELVRVPVQVDLWVADAVDGERVARDSTRTSVTVAGAPASEMRAWRRRMPAGAYMYRVEALQPEVQRGAIGAASVSTPAGVRFALDGFGVSDLLVAERLQRRTDRPLRWTDYNVVPNAGMLRQGQQVALLWESYDLARTPAGTNELRVDLAVLPVGGTTRADFTVRVVGGLWGVGLSGRAGDRVAIGFTRELPARAIHVDDVVLDLGATPPGTYLIRVTLTDLVAKASTTRETAVTVTR